MLKWALLFLVFWAAKGQNLTESPLTIVVEWSHLEFAFPSEKHRQRAIDKEHYIPGDPSYNVPIDVDVYYGKHEQRIFITIPRFGKGRPITLGTLSGRGAIFAYPDYSWNDRQGKNCDGFTSVFRTKVDECGRLWVLDSGKIGEHFYCPPQLVAFNLTNDEVIYRHRLRDYLPQSLYITPVIDVRSNDCSGTFAYLADVAGFGLSVVDVDRDRSWRIQHRLFYPHPSAGTFIINGVKFDLMDGIFGLALSPLKNEDRTLYFHALASVTENAVQTKFIRDEDNAAHMDPDNIWTLPGERSNQSAAEAMDRNGILYFGIMNPPSIWCWNSNTKYSDYNFNRIAVDEDTLQFASGLKVITRFDGNDEIWILISNFQRVYTGTLDPIGPNFRILKGNLNEILSQSPCSFPVGE